MTNTNLVGAFYNSETIFPTGTNLSKAIYLDSGANLSHIYFTKISLSGVNLSNTNLSNSILKYIDLSYANLSNANLTNANLEGAILDNANLEGAIFCKTIMPDGSVRNNCY
ncbi:pentapeptide repeat-containing protein [Nostoc sp.]|uniref:pentapeptide repeat-containing protein n=1 Tax=Nostoc sp. TaxID=1180 RepID=UPI003FA58439